ncbi:hypothetical protein LCGC14_0320660 [marine sediment metagenome]|uniref:ATPase BadF/BadG/BcrA/BcrD type domain-containing protein n=1 Tax=marine sediment metagenome TaxID=412755 RepID=A0A0F9TPU1_9ZZZZ|nr:hypothetical protein [bacterium]
MVDESILKIDEHKAQYFEGIEIGAVSVKWVRMTQDGVILSEVIRHEGYPREKIKEIFTEHKSYHQSKIAITGNAAKSLLNLPYYSEAECLERALSYYKLKPDILLSLGGETFTVFPMKDGIIRNIISTSKCAAGTGEFIVQQLQRMGLSIEEGIEASKKGEFTPLATRCSVHCKSDATHKLNKGECKPEDITKTLIYDLARKVSEMIKTTQWPTKLIVLSGGVSLNKILIENLQSFLPNSVIKVIPESPFFEVFGASLFASEIQNRMPPPEKWFKPTSFEFETHKPLRIRESLLDYRVDLNSKEEIKNNDSYILGIDAGSTTTKAVLFNISDNSIGASAYLRTLGNPVLATKLCIEELIKRVGDKTFKIIQCGTTGSAREMVSVYLNNCRSFNEILAHARSATEEVPEVDTVFEIGGQDSKFISFLKGIPIDYAMNEGCSAGTGSFIEESASVDMGIPVEKISDVALKSENPVAFGERCAAFINTDLRNALQQGVEQTDVVAGLVYSIADNYISRIVGPRHLGEKILFLGGVALNKAIALAMVSRSNRKIIVPAHPELMGSVGTALMSRDLIEEGILTKQEIILEDFTHGDMQLKSTFRCKACENNCDIQNISIRGKVYPFGGLCSKYKLQRQKGKEVREGRDIVSLRNEIIYNEFGPKKIENPRGTIGLPMGLTSHSLFPLYTKFINTLGFDVIISKLSKAGNNNTAASICYPCELIHGAVRELLDKEVDYIFMPKVIKLEPLEGYYRGNTCGSTILITDILRSTLEIEKDKILSPHIGLSNSLRFVTLKEFGKVAEKLGLNSEVGVKAGEKAFEHYNNFTQKYAKIGENLIKELLGEPSVIIAGRPYVIYPSEINLALPRKIVSRGYNVIPADILPSLKGKNIKKRNAWNYTQQIEKAVQYAKLNPNLYICLVSCFSCAPDATMYHYFRQNLSGSTFCYLEIDSHTAHAGFDTRVGAFLDIVEERRRKLNNFEKK